MAATAARLVLGFSASGLSIRVDAVPHGRSVCVLPRRGLLGSRGLKGHAADDREQDADPQSDSETLLLHRAKAFRDGLRRTRSVYLKTGTASSRLQTSRGLFATYLDGRNG